MRVFNTGETQEELREKYNPEGSDLRKAQIRILAILRYIDEVCRKQGLSYSLDGGNVLGAVRHGGFIPWDDDADVLMEWQDYIKFRRYVLKHPHPQFVLQCHKTDRHFYQTNGVMRDLNSEYLIDSPMHMCRKYRGMQVDIFPIERGAFRGIHTFLGKIGGVTNLRFAGHSHFLATVSLYATFFLCYGARLISKLFGDKDHCMYFYSSYFQEEFRYQDVFPPKPILFEGIWLMGPRNVDKQMRAYYGDYMSLPPEEARNHHSVQRYRID